MKLEPRGDRVLIAPDPLPTQTESGLHLVEHRKPETSGTVAALPPAIAVTCPECGHVFGREPAVRVGDTVAFSWMAGQEVFIDDVRYFLMRESDLLAVVEGE